MAHDREDLSVLALPRDHVSVLLQGIRTHVAALEGFVNGESPGPLLQSGCYLGPPGRCKDVVAAVKEQRVEDFPCLGSQDVSSYSFNPQKVGSRLGYVLAVAWQGRRSCNDTDWTCS